MTLCTHCNFQVFAAEFLAPFEVKVRPFSPTSTETRMTNPCWRIVVTDCNGGWVTNNVPSGLTLEEEAVVAARYATALNAWDRADGGRVTPCDGARADWPERKGFAEPPSPFEWDYRQGMPDCWQDYVDAIRRGA